MKRSAPIPGGCVFVKRSANRLDAMKSTNDTTINTTSCTPKPTPNRASTPATAAPIPNQRRKNAALKISPTKKTAARTIQIHPMFVDITLTSCAQ